MDFRSAMTKNPLHTFIFFIGWLLYATQALAFNDVELSIWSNEVIVSAYTLSADTLLASQKSLARYFTNTAWVDYTKALQTSKLNDAIQKNNYTVSAVALLPPTVKTLREGIEWQATMPLLVLYKNNDYQQKQTLEVVITFVKAKANEGVRGLAITSFNTTISTAPCRCAQWSKTKTFV